MSADVVIRAEGLGKKYVIGHQAVDRKDTFRDTIVRTAKQFARTAADVARGRPIIAGEELEDFWALKDVSFEIKRGDVVGVIGRNGAGKSTLLKVLSRITEPSEGRVEIKGRVASLLEVGTGFHPELTGRENVYLNGAILGMTRAEIARKFDEIVAFAEVEKFLDTPVKRYSSGMYVRLAFAVAAHLEPEILIVDEVLAVGDAEFQAKCLGKMQDVASHGRTVLFVSHSLASIQRLCKSGILLANGSIQVKGHVDTVIERYVSEKKQSAAVGRSTNKRPTECAIDTVSVTNAEGSATIGPGDSILITVKVAGEKGPTSCAIAIRHPHDITLYWFKCDQSVSPGSDYQILVKQPNLLPGDYTINVAFRRGNMVVDRIENAAVLEVSPGMFAGHMIDVNRPAGILIADHQWLVTETV